MNYELAKKLKDAGFPQYKSEKRWFIEHSFPTVKKPEKYNIKHWKYIATTCMNKITAGKQWGSVDELCDNPTLSELIEACGEGLSSLTQSPRKTWYTATPQGSVEMVVGDEYSTPEESIANLWLALNK